MSRRNFIKSTGLGIAGLSLSACASTGPFVIGRNRKPRPFAIIALPDTQYYSQSWPEIFKAQTEWIRDNKEGLDIFMVVHEGDITEDNLVPEWENARAAMDVLDGHVPYTLNSGNHDQPGWGRERHLNHFYDYFPLERYKDLPWFGGTWKGGMENAYWKFERDGIPYLVLCLEFGPREEPIEWAHTVLNMHPEHRVIFSTHCYTYSDNTRVGPGDDWNPRGYAGGGNDGEELWEKLVRQHKNIFLVLSGHILHDGKGRLTTPNNHGVPVHQILANYQMLHRGGDGWLRIMKIDPENNLIDVKTYSPVLKQFATDEQNQFVLHNAFNKDFFAV